MKKRIMVFDPIRFGTTIRPPLNAEYTLHLLLSKDERDAVIGDLIEDYGRILGRFGRVRADFWFYKQGLSLLWPLVRRAGLRIGTYLWLGNLVRRLLS